MTHTTTMLHDQLVVLRAMLRIAITNGWADIASTISDQIIDLRRDLARAG